jgi:predicted nucleic acid-binding protein
MATVFLDSSALFRRYARSEPGAAAVRSICSPSRGATLLVARIATIEIASALSRQTREGRLSSSDGARYWRLFRNHQHRQYQLIQLTDDVFADAERLVFTHPLRAYDAVHLACALAAAAQLPSAGLEFWTGDRRQAQAATAEGLAVRLVG